MKDIEDRESSGNGQNESDDEHENYFAGGGKNSGINIQDPNRKPISSEGNPLVKELLRKAQL